MKRAVRRLLGLFGLPATPATGGRLGPPRDHGDDVPVKLSPGYAYCPRPGCDWEYETNDEIAAVYAQARHQADTHPTGSETKGTP